MVGTKRAVVIVNGKSVKVGNTNSWEGFVATFIASQDVRESSRQTYTKTLTQFFRWVEESGKNLSTMLRGDILEYKDSLLSRGLSPLSVGSYLEIVRKFYEWVEAEGLGANIAKGVKSPKKKNAFKKQHLSVTKTKELLSHFESLSLRDYAIVNLCLRCGLRTIEVIRANVEDITFKGDRRILRVWGKGRDDKSDYVVLSDKAYLPIRNYLAAERKGAKGGEPLFTSVSRHNQGGRLTTRSISRICKDGLKAIDLEGREFTAHSLRHTTGCLILKNGGQLTDVQTILRHSSTETSQIYVESIKEELRLQNSPEFILDKAF